ncbi:hypothetical protein A2U01_0093838, partial [Trifolium medium]|nr:hypothetical protein [Trifolium medium]
KTHNPVGSGPGATRVAVWRNAPCIPVSCIFLLVPAQCASVVDATRSVGLLRVGCFLLAAQRAGWCCTARRLGL